jgi:methyl-accepting chemotaxis protein
MYEVISKSYSAAFHGHDKTEVSKMTLRTKLLAPTLLAIFLSFSAFAAFQIVSQNRKTDAEINEDITNLTELVATANMSYTWNYDTIGLQQSLESLIKNRQIVSIEIFDASGASMAKVEEEALPTLYTKEADILRDGQLTGKAKIVFTDYYIRAATRELLSQIVILQIVLFLVMVTVMIFVSRLITRPILRLTDIIRDMAEGEADLTIRIPVRGNDEVAKLSGYFNDFLEKLKTIVVSLKSVGIKSGILGGNLAEHSQSVSSSSSQMSASTRSMSERTGVLREEIFHASENVAKINIYIGQVVEKIQEQAAAVNESSAAIEQMIANVGNIERSTENKLELIRGLESQAKNLEEGTSLNLQAMEEVSKSTELIAEMITVIDNVASQTNLLAMNAAIEAAHAGDYGRGFSVVADEIRKLAEQTAENAKSIGTSISQVVTGIEKATGMTRDSSVTISDVISGITDVTAGMNETMAGLKEISIGNQQITESLGELIKMTEDVKGSGKGMSEGTTEIDFSMKKVTGIIEENKNGIEEMAGGIKEISESMAKLLDLSNENSVNISTLDSEISKFKIE